MTRSFRRKCTVRFHFREFAPRCSKSLTENRANQAAMHFWSSRDQRLFCSQKLREPEERIPAELHPSGSLEFLA
jgi:hypothetical protein